MLAQKRLFSIAFYFQNDNILFIYCDIKESEAHSYGNLCKITGVCKQLSLPKSQIV